MIPWVDGRLVRECRCLAGRSGCVEIAADPGCADLSRGGDRATGPGQGRACPTGQGNPGKMDDAARAGQAARADRESEEARRLANMAARQAARRCGTTSTAR